uniref:Uncharacterized protein n=1 Tax=Palpitomonas bilix TaxID=652834 RepID=A0A7S3D0D1_9EUKA|mmetsp:Transcript_16853/g.42290  ORF Transcript_16853/g.42290 Transcript_16853/m.42290 type:complete len:235 (+) Transcript_16853:151-855(+)
MDGFAELEEIGLGGFDFTSIGGVPIPRRKKYKALCPLFDGMSPEEEALYLPILLKELEEEEAEEEKFYSNVEEVLSDLKPFNEKVMTNPTYFEERTRFSHDNFLILLQKFEFPREFQTPRQDTCPGAFALFVVCVRLAYHSRLQDFEHFFNRDRYAADRINRSALHHIFKKKGFLVTMHPCLSKRKVQKHFDERIKTVTKADRIPIFAIIDGASRKKCRPTTGQVSGQKKERFC